MDRLTLGGAEQTEGVYTANFVFMRVSSVTFRAGLHTAVIMLKQAHNGKASALSLTHEPRHALLPRNLQENS